MLRITSFASLDAVRHDSPLTRLWLWVLPVLLLLPGCGGGLASSIEGKVTLDDKNVTGNVIYVGGDDKELVAPIRPDGTFTVLNPPTGKGMFMVRSVGGAGSGPVVMGIKKGTFTQPKIGDMVAGGVDPPVKYATPMGAIKYDMPGGHQKFDLKLTR